MTVRIMTVARQRIGMLGYLAIGISQFAICNLQLSSLNAQLVASRPTDEAITLELDNTVTKRLASVEDFVAERQWDIVSTLLRQTQAEKSDKLVAIAPGWYVSVQRYCQCRAALLPPAGLAAYRNHVDATAKKWLDDAQRTHDRAAYLRIARQAFASSYGDEALRRLAELSWEQADFAAARTYWEMLLPVAAPLRSAAGIGLLRHPDSSFDPAQMRAHLILCSLFKGNHSRAEQELAVFRRVHGEATGRLAGRDGVLVELLTLSLWPSVLKGGKEGDGPQLDRRCWSVSLPAPRIDSADKRDLFPVLASDTLFTSNGESVFALDVVSGQPKWPGDAADGDSPQAASIHSLADPIAPRWPVVGRRQQTLSIYGDRLYARLGTPVTGRAKQETESHSELVGLDIGSGEGKLVWRVAAEEVDPQDPLRATAPWCFEGSPVADARRVFVALRRSLPQEQINVACFDAETAKLLWNRKVGITVASTDETVNATSHLLLTLAEDSVFLSTDAGAIAALEAHDGAIRWIRTYSPASSAARDHRRGGLTPCSYHNGVLYVAPLDSDLLMALHAESGLRLWQKLWPDPIQYLLGISGDTLIVSGRSLWGVNLSTGELAWPQRRIGYDDPEGFSSGCGVLVGDDVWWPHRDELLVVSATTGQITRRVELRESIHEQGGRVAAFGVYLLMSHGNRLTMLGPK